ncbi:hypothetical protein A1O1_03410 [Capronia coronata CBS 617.96]|uniref:BTB domain-containing protein n=1 Tax=Capronia coronata CBS 617.96 TaxID=1182541 RepID=W9YM46_9EURO|nr:uncharacterized protein A1O1_03410 [Capronia coronata CBS 617.96]EXJ90311.1 hypothetical protein A1O1_03410 [Capronia coronata CBS 617.96]
MASKSSNNHRAGNQYGRMIQPALPILPVRTSAKTSKTKPVAQQEVKETKESSTAQTVANPQLAETANESFSLSSARRPTQSSDESLAHQEAFAPTDTSSVPTQDHSPAPQEPATEPAKDAELSKKEAAATENEPVSNTEVGLTDKDTMPTPVPESKGEMTGSDPDGGGAVTDPTFAPYSQSFAPLSMTTSIGSRRALSGPGPSVGFSPPAEKLADHDIVNGTQPVLQAENGGSPVSQSQIHAAYEPGPASTASSVLHGPSTNGVDPPMTASTATSSRPTPVPRHFNALVGLPDHLLSIASTKEGADWAIQVSPPTGQPFVTFAHSLIVCRSLRVRKLMDRQKGETYAANLVTLFPACQVLPHAFEAALRFLYSDTVLSDNFFFDVLPGPDHHATRLHNLDYILSYWVAGIELGLEPVSVCAETLLAKYLKWDVVEAAYKHALELGNSPLLSVGKHMTGTDYLVASNSVIRQVLQFLAHNIDVDKFVLDVNNPSTVFPPRLPQLDDGRPRFNPALASMVFGSMSPSPPQSDTAPITPSYPDTVASNILLNVDFENLNFFNELLRARGNPASAKLMAAVVAERETRRQKVISAQSFPNRERMQNSSLWEPVGLRESLKGTVLIRDRVGFLLSKQDT